MSGASREHNLICVNVSSVFHSQLRQRPCETYAGDMRVKVSPTGLYTYPDVVVVCDEPQFEDAQVDTLLNEYFRRAAHALSAEMMNDKRRMMNGGRKAGKGRWERGKRVT